MRRTAGRWRKLAAVAAAVALLLPLLLGVAVGAEPGTDGVLAATGPDEEGNRTVALYYDDLVLRGNSARHDAFFEIGKGQQVIEGSYLDLQFSYSPALVADLSYLTVLIDDIPVGGVSLNNKETSIQSWRVDLSHLGLGPGYHKVSLLARMKVSSLQVCEDPSNELLWLVAHKTSKAVLKLGPMYTAADLSWYPSPFIERGGDHPLHAVLIVPERFGAAEFSTAARLSQFFTAQTPEGRLQIPIYLESDVTEAILQSRHAIWIGSVEKWQGHGIRLSEAAGNVAGRELKGQGVIAEVQSPWNAVRTHLLITGNDEQLDAAADILTTESLYRQLQGNVLNIPEKPLQPEAAKVVKPGDSYAVTLQQLGYDILKTEGVLFGSTQFEYNIPIDLDWGDGVRLHLKYAHSKSILYHKSVMTVKVNGTPVESVGLTERSSSGGALDVLIEPALMGASRKLNVEVGFQFANPAAEQAADRGYSCADTLLGDWAVVEGETMLSFTPKARETAYLQSLPFPFVKGNRWEPTAILAESMGTRELQLAMTLIGKMGASMPNVEALQMELTSAPGWEERVKNRHLVYIGTSTEIPAAVNGFTDSYVRFASDSLVSQSPVVQLLEPLKRNFAVMQLTRSPLSADHRLLLMAAAVPERLGAIGAALTHPEDSGKLSTRLAVIDNQGAVFAFPDTEDRIARATTAPGTANARWTNFSINGYAFAAVLLVIVSAIGFAVYWGYRKAK